MYVRTFVYVYVHNIHPRASLRTVSMPTPCTDMTSKHECSACFSGLSVRSSGAEGLGVPAFPFIELCENPHRALAL